MVKSFRDVIALFGSADALARAMGLGKFMVRNWRSRDNIPGEYWLGVIKAARKGRLALSLEDLARIAAGRLKRAA